MSRNVEVIMPKKDMILGENGTLIPKKKRVCAYCRVSTDDIEQKHSYDTQVEEYTKRITSNPEWEFVKIYADEGISGTDIKKRDSFNQMMDDARAGKIDLILSKSVSRFGRNTLNTISAIRELKALKIGVYFENENVNTLDEASEFMLTIMSSMAQEEARHISENVRWTMKKKFKEGVPMFCHSTFLGYTKDPITKKIIIVEEEAKIIREIFELYVNNVGPNEICRIMESKGYLTGRGNKKWNLSYVQSILKNEKYCGDLLLQKTVTTDFLAHKRKRNVNDAPMYYVKDNHEPIVSREIWNLAKEIRERRFKTRLGLNKDQSKYLNKYPFSGLLMCANCGSPFKRRYWNYGYSSQHVVMQCSKHIEDSKICSPGAIDLTLLEETTSKMINELFSDRKDLIKEIEEIIKEHLEVSNYEILLAEIKDKKVQIIEKMSKVLDLKLSARTGDEIILYEDKYESLSKELENLNLQEYNLEKYITKDSTSRTRFQLIKNKLYDDATPLSGEFLNSVINKILVIDKENIIYLIPKSQFLKTEDINLHIKRFLSMTPLFTGSHIRTHNNKTYKINYSVVII